MGKKLFPPNIIALAQDILVGWGQVSTTLIFGTVTPATLSADLAAAAPLEAEISKLERQLADKRNQRELLYNSIWEKVKRIRSGVKAAFGDDSQQYEMVGGKRMSERKPRARKGTTTE